MTAPRHFTLPVLLAILLTVACAGSDSDPPRPEPDEASESERIGREVGETYLLLMEDVTSMLELNLPADQLRPALGRLRDDYRVRFANLGCLREDMPQSQRPEVKRLADDYVQINGGQDTAWLTQGTQRYANDPQIPKLLTEIQGLRVYAFFEELARLRPGDTVLCDS